MSRYVHGFSLFLFFLYFSLISLVFSQLSPTQRDTMIKLSKSVNNNTGNSSVWDTRDPNPCSWKGVICSTNNGFITHVSLSRFDLSTSDFLTDLCQIDSLQSLDLSINSLSSIPDGFISDCGKIDGLKMLNFSQNRLSGLLPIFHGFSGLESLDLSLNSFRGNIDVQLDGLIGVKNLNLSTNLFNGPVPTHLGKSLVLEELQLSKNRFDGQIPDKLFSYQNLTLIDLSKNYISGSVPNSIGNLSKLEILLLSSNVLSGNIPENLFNIETLTLIDLSNNKISGSVPNSVDKLSKLEILLLSSNDLSGIIPENLSNIETLTRLAANQNRFIGTIPPQLSQFVNHVDLSYNNLTGSIPADLLSSPSLQSADLSYNSLVGPIPTNISKNLFRLRLGSNFLNGSIPSAAIGELVKLTYLELDNNNLSGEIPKELGNCVELALLNLAENELTGLLPRELGNLSQLRVMKLQSNHLIGEIPDQFSHLQNLLVLNISQNSLTGSIPSGISNLKKLGNFNLQDNKLNGSIPDSISRLELLLELQLGKNYLSGKIPNMPPKLQIALNLSYNCFEGPIPETLGELSALEVLDLSNNKFSGKIPIFLTKLESLTKLLLSNNQLSGNLPLFRPYVLVDTSGNKDLINATTYTSPNKRISVTVAILIAVTSVVLAFAITGAIILIVSRRFYRINDENLHSEEQLSLPQVINGHLLTTNSIHRSNIDFATAMKAVSNPTNIILKSRFSTYYKAVMPCGRDYYVKKLNWDDKIFQLGSHERFGKELEVLGRLNNSNVMVPLAYVLTVDSAYLFYEYAQKGTLFDVLHGNLGKVLDWTSRYSIAIGIAQGLAFLHGCNSGSVPLLDLSARTIFLKSLKEPQIGDIELFEVIDPSKSTGSLSTVAGSVGYIPPEYAYTMRVTLPGNVYSFGVILLELLTGKPAVSEGTELAKWVLSNSIHRETWDQILDPSVSKTSHWVRSQMLSVLKVALGCVSVSPEVRPKMKNALNMLVHAK